MFFFQRDAELFLYKQEYFAMGQARKHFSQDYLLEEVRKLLGKGLKKEQVKDSKKAAFSNLDCLMGWALRFYL